MSAQAATENGAVDQLTGVPLVEMSGIAKAYGETKALRDCSISIAAGEVHALVGENGSGKSTLVKILSGVVGPDSGTLSVAGRPVEFGSPAAAQAAGIATVFQETLVIDELSVRDNIALGVDGMFRHDPHRWAAEEAIVRAVTALDLAGVDLDAPVWQLNLADRQLVTVARALVRPWKLLILDESTSALDVQHRDRLLDFVVGQRDAGRSVMVITHRVAEIRRVADRVTIMRSGVSVETIPRERASAELMLSLASSGVDREAVAPSADDVRSHRRARSADAQAVFRIGGLRIYEHLPAFDLTVARGEILGVAGLEGHGAAEFVECISGVRTPFTGEVELDGPDGPRAITSLQRAGRAGVGYVPRERKREGIFPSRSVADNMTVAVLDRLSSAGLLRRGLVKRAVRTWMTRLEVRPSRPATPVGSLSGGNQQKVVLARALLAEPNVLVLNDPMRGVDHGTKLDIYELFRALADDGLALVMLSTEIEELLLLCDRIAVFREGTLGAVLERDAFSTEEVVNAMFGHRRSTEAS